MELTCLQAHIKHQRGVDKDGDLLADLVCPVCLMCLHEPVALPCQHFFCKSCFRRVWKNGKRNCPVCRSEILLHPSHFETNRLLAKLIKLQFPDHAEKSAQEHALLEKQEREVESELEEPSAPTGGGRGEAVPTARVPSTPSVAMRCLSCIGLVCVGLLFFTVFVCITVLGNMVINDNLFHAAHTIASVHTRKELDSAVERLIRDAIQALDRFDFLASTAANFLQDW